MATERRRRLARLLAALAAAGVVAMVAPATAHAAPPWWEQLAFAGQRVTSVAAQAGQVVVAVGSTRYLSVDGGRSFTQGAAAGEVRDPAATMWEIHNGTVFTGPPGERLVADPHSPFLGDTAHLIAAPAALPGVAVAVGSDNHVWRRDASGQWATAFILLPAGGVSGIPQVTALAAFTQPLSHAMYMGTAGYGVLVSQDGGDDWIRADPGLPANVLALATDSSEHALYAATDRGLFVHHLQALPAPPVYHDAMLLLRWLGIALVALLATVVATLGLRRALPVEN